MRRKLCEHLKMRSTRSVVDKFHQQLFKDQAAKGFKATPAVLFGSLGALKDIVLTGTSCRGQMQLGDQK